MTYNPFDKSPTDTLTAEDLNQLLEKNVAEGYYVEYKSQFVRNEKIGWSISSFANTYGGWYIVGVKEDKKNNVAREICGFDISEYPEPIDKIREIIKSNINPVPLFYPQLIKLNEEKYVLAVYIPDEQDKPFICINGRIYRRTQDSSDPILENNRYALDKLYEEGKERRKKYKKFCRDERIHDTENAWVQIFLSPYPRGIINNNSELNTWSRKDIERMIKLSKQPIANSSFETLGLTGNVPFNSGQTSLHSLIFRQNNGGLTYNSLEFELFKNLQGKCFIPLEYRTPWKENAFCNLTESTQKIIHKLYHSEKIQTKDNLEQNFFLFDIGRLYMCVINLINFYQYLLSEQPYVNQVEVTIVIEKVKKHIPFYDCEEWAKHIDNLGFPRSDKNLITIGRTKDRGALFDCDEKSNLCSIICALIGNGFGLPIELTTEIISKSLLESGIARE